MKNEYIVERKKSVSIKSFLLCFIISIVFIVFLVLDILKIVDMKEKRTFLYILIILVTPILLFASFFYFKQLFNNKPILKIDANGFLDNFSRPHVGLILWEDISDVAVLPYMGDTYIISIKLKDPLKYFKKPRKKITKTDGDIMITSLYFKKEINEVVLMMKYYIEQSRKEQEKYEF